MRNHRFTVTFYRSDGNPIEKIVSVPNISEFAHKTLLTGRFTELAIKRIAGNQCISVYTLSADNKLVWSAQVLKVKTGKTNTRDKTGIQTRGRTTLTFTPHKVSLADIAEDLRPE